MKVNICFASNEVNKKRKKSLINTKNTGYAATAGLGLSIISGYSKNKTFNKSHKYFAAFSALSLIAHIYSIYHRKTNKK